MPKWLEKAVFYEIYPQSFYDSNSDGIGDIPGIIEKLDYIKGLGCNALWLNPCYDSPFKDAGYDVRDYKKVATRYGTNEDLFRLFNEAHKRKMRVLLDMVPGHTSEEHPWFIESRKANPGKKNKNRYIWTNNFLSSGSDGLKFIAGESERDGCYCVNFFKCQPALNYGFQNPREKWQLPPTHPDCIATMEAIKDIMRFWLKGDNGRGCDGFRMDMAFTLVKAEDSERSATSAIWRNIRKMLDTEFPEAAMVSEWGSPSQAINAGFHADFMLELFEPNGYATLFRDFENGVDNSYFKKNSHGDINRFLSKYLPLYDATKKNGYISLVTGNHDLPRANRGLSARELALAYALIFTFPGVPFLYYGDEIGMRYINDLPSKEGGFYRTGSRTPMQWISKAAITAAPIPPEAASMGFSAAPAEQLYLPVDPDPDAPSVEIQEKDTESLLNTVRALLHLRQDNKDLNAKPNLEILYAGKYSDRCFIYRRGAFIITVNPDGKAVQVSFPIKKIPKLVYSIGTCNIDGGFYKMGPQSFSIWK
ncbi:MAG: alpha-amylase family glycosyl hydrolase [Treponema sp.]|nr:alpha-amylase family glycosyl hydrolase [Treponema sp.]